MIRSLWIAKTGMEGQQTKLDTVTNNLANVGTNGFKRAGVVFEDLMYQNLRQTGAAAGEGTTLPTGNVWLRKLSPNACLPTGLPYVAKLS